jgi:hypothetical protein
VKSVFAPAPKVLPGAKRRFAPGAKRNRYETGVFAFPSDRNAVSDLQFLSFYDIRAVVGRLFPLKEAEEWIKTHRCH